MGYDPPQSIVVLLDSELAEMEHTSTPLVRPPRGFELLWHDESDRADRCLSIWRPVPFPGWATQIFSLLLRVHSKLGHLKAGNVSTLCTVHGTPGILRGIREILSRDITNTGGVKIYHLWCRYIAMGFVVGRGPHPPSRNAIRCVRCVAWSSLNHKNLGFR